MKIPAMLILAAPADERRGEELTKFLAPPCRAQILRIPRFNPNEALSECRSWTSQQLEQVEVVALLVSQQLFAAQYWDLLREQLLKAHERAKEDGRPFIIVPVVLEQCRWEDDPFLARFCKVPRNGKTIRCKDFWPEVSNDLLTAVASVSGGKLP